MKNILLLLNGNIAKSFLARLKEVDLSKKRFFIVYYDDDTICEDLGRDEHFLLYKFDPTSKVKLQALLNRHDFSQAMIILANKIDTVASYENIRDSLSEIEIIIYDNWQLEIDDGMVTLIDSRDLISNILVNYLPDIPLYATHIGLGQGEIVEIKIPFGSPFTYRYISNIEQKRWKIVAIYRSGRLIIPDYKTSLKPNDSIVCVGNPHVLKSVYKSIHREVGQFPVPFGENIYLFIDMSTMSDSDIEKLIDNGMIFHSKLNSNRLVFRVINPKYGDLLNKIKSYDKASMKVELDFYSKDLNDLIIHDVSKFQIGLFITDDKFFTKNIDMLHSLKTPVLKIGDKSFFNIKESAVLSNDSKAVEKISSTIFDLSTQLHLNILIYEFEDESSDEFKKVVNHFNNLSRLFNQEVKVIQTRRNPLRELQDRDDLLQFVLFDNNIEPKSIFSYFSKNVNRLYFQLSKNYQLFLPSDE
ncbi:MAG: potassium transporter TrkA [Sulfurospirillum sp.]|nr:MAG: potassium transporter TrkA [Sulfurospirillum sp.]